MLALVVALSSVQARVFQGTLNGAQGPTFIGRFAYGVDSTNGRTYWV